MMTVDRILVPHDFSETSAVAVRYAVALARTFGAGLHFLHVESVALFPMDPPFPLGLEEAVDVAARERLLAIVSPAEQAALQPRFITRTGVPAVEIVRYASEADADLIVMGTHGRGLIAHALLGSVAEQVVRTAPCPVLTVRDPRQASMVMAEVDEAAGATA